jgi:hypothetical protein
MITDYQSYSDKILAYARDTRDPDNIIKLHDYLFEDTVEDMINRFIGEIHELGFYIV